MKHKAFSDQVAQCRRHAPLRPWAERPGEVGLETAITWPGVELAGGATPPWPSPPRRRGDVEAMFRSISPEIIQSRLVPHGPGRLTSVTSHASFLGPKSRRRTQRPR